VSVDAIVETNMAGRAPLPPLRLESSLSNCSIALTLVSYMKIVIQWKYPVYHDSILKNVQYCNATKC
jgi:hypothetical protein